MPATAKYEEHGGPGWRVCFEIVDSNTRAPAAQRIELLNRLFFNLCLGNNDAHAKNFALLHGRKGGPRLTAAYDLLCTQVYRTLSSTMAMAIGGQTNPDNLSPEAWRMFGRETGFGVPALRRFGVDMANRVKAALSDLLSEVEAASPAVKSDVYPLMRRAKFFKRYAAIVSTNCDDLLKSFSPATSG